MSSNFTGSTVEDTLKTVFEATDGPIYAVAPDPEFLGGLVGALDSASRPVRLLAPADVLREAFGEFRLAGRAADLVAADVLEIRRHDGRTNALVVSAASVVSIVRAGDRVAGLVTEESEFIKGANDRLEEAWEDATLYELRTPPLSRVRETLESELGEATAADFEALLGGDNGLDEVTASLLAAAKNEVLLYDVSKWGEDVGVASKATFSRTKTDLEEAGLIETESVPIDVGRPRLRLKLGDERLTDEDFAETAQSLAS